MEEHDASWKEKLTRFETASESRSRNPWWSHLLCCELVTCAFCRNDWRASHDTGSHGCHWIDVVKSEVTLGGLELWDTFLHKGEDRAIQHLNLEFSLHVHSNHSCTVYRMLSNILTNVFLSNSKVALHNDRVWVIVSDIKEEYNVCKTHL